MDLTLEQHMMDNGINSPPSIQFDERIHRFKTRKNKKNGWYIAFSNPEVVVYGDWTEPDVKHVWKSQGASQMTPEQRKQIEAKRKAAFQRAAKRKSNNWRRISRFCAQLQPATNHPYLNKKQITASGALEYRSHKRHLLIVPMKDFGRRVCGAQMVYANGFKRYMKSSKSKGVYFGIGTPDSMLYIAEGFATAATINAVTNQAVAVAFSTGNLLDCTAHFRKTFPDKRIVIAADNDRWTAVNTARGKVENPGLYYAEQASQMTNCEYRLPQFQNLQSKPTDFNDLYALEGDQAVRLYLDQLVLNNTVADDSKQYDYDDQVIEIDESDQSNADQKQEDPKPKRLSDSVFRCLGFDSDNYYFLPHKTNKIVTLSRSSMGSKTHLLSLAPLDWWIDVMFGGEKPQWEFATDYLMRVQEASGMFDPSRIRGRGAWFDNGRSVLHIGNRLIVDGEPVNIHEFETNYIYELAPATESTISTTPATVDEAKQVYLLFQELNFERHINASFLAGWCFLAPICSALDWRPHIWITGARGTGKTWIQENLVDPIVGDGAFRTQGSTTEAGIRQTLKQDGRPVIFDESEGEDQSSRRRMQSVIELARQASSNSNSGITKGTANGDAMVFFVRSMFMFGSINVGISQAADESRISVLTLAKHKNDKASVDEFHAFEKQVNKLMSPEFTAKIRARAYKMIPVIRANSKTFARAIAEELGSQRMGDQYGALLAGAFGLIADDTFDLDKARQWVSKLDFEEAKESEDIKDEDRLVNALLQSMIRVEIGSHNFSRTVAEFIKIAQGFATDGISPTDAFYALQRYGIKVESDVVYVSNSHSQIKMMLKDTPWESNWSRVLVRFSGAFKPKSAVRFGEVINRCVAIPYSNLF